MTSQETKLVRLSILFAIIAVVPIIAGLVLRSFPIYFLLLSLASVFASAGLALRVKLSAPQPVERGRELSKKLEKPVLPPNGGKSIDCLAWKIPDVTLFPVDAAGRALEWNESVARVLGYPEHEFRGNALTDLIAAGEGDAQKAEELLKAAARRNPQSIETWLLKKDRTRFWGVLTVQPLDEAEASVDRFAAIIRDQSDAKLLEDALRESEGRLRSVIDNTSAVIHVKDPMGRYLMVNRQWQNMTRVSMKDALGKSVHDFYSREDAEKLLRHDRLVLERGQAMEFEESIRHPDGLHTYLSIKFPIFDSDGEPYAVGGISTDITARKQAQQALQRNEALKGAMLEASLDAIVTIDARGRIAEFSRSAERIFGYKREDVIGKEVAETIIPPHLRQKHREGMARYLSTGETRVIGQRVELPAMRANGEQFPAELAISRIAIEGPPLFTAYVRDISERKAAEIALRRSEEQLRVITDSVPALVAYIDTSGRYRFNNKAYEDWLGIRREEILGQPVRDVLGPVIYARVEPYIRAALSGTRSKVEISTNLPDGRPIEFLATYVPHRGPDGKVEGCIGLKTDITDRKQAEERQRFLAEAGGVLARSLDYETTLSHVAHLAVPTLADWCAIHRKDSRGLIQPVVVAHADKQKEEWVRGVLAKFRVDPQSPYGAAHVIRTGEPQIVPLIDESIIQQVSMGDPERLALLTELDLRSFISVPLISRGEVLGALTFASSNPARTHGEQDLWLLQEVARRAATAIDNALLYRAAEQELEERRRVEEALRSSEERFRAVVEQSPVSIQFLSPDGFITEVNNAWRDLWQVDLDDVRDYNLLRDPYLERQGITPYLRKAFKGLPVEIPPVYFDPAELGRSGRARWTEAFLYPIKGENGEIHEVVLMHLDITQRKEAENELRSANQELTEAVRELEAFSYTISHDLRAPLRSIDAFSRMLETDFAQNLDPEGRRYLDLVKQNVGQMGNLIDDLLSFARLGRQPLSKTEVSVLELIRPVWTELLLQNPGRNVEFRTDNLRDCTILADPSLLRQVYVNLLSNALKFTRKRDQAAIEVGCFEREGDTIWYVRDNGVGFKMKYAGKLFGVFQRLHRAEDYEGTGVGLAIIHRIIHRHGGRVWAEAEEEEGATFFFTVG